MTRQELVAIIAASASVKKDVADRVLDVFVEAVSDAVSRRDEVTLRGFGKFYNAYRGPRVARNMTTGESIKVSEKRLFKFKPCNALRGRMK